MSDQNELERLRGRLNLARREINQGRPDAALEVIKPVASAIESREGTLEWAELPLVIGEALTAQNKEEALSYLQDAFSRIEKVYDAPIELRIRAHEHLGNFQRLCARRRSIARENYVTAVRYADEAEFTEDSYRLRLKICGIDLETDEDTNHNDFLTLIRVGKREGFTAKEQFDTWNVHLAKIGTFAKTLKVARKFGDASEEYFLNLLNSTRNEKKAQ